jgi:large subunit ribosomal protein L6e
MVHAPRNKSLIRGVPALGRAEVYKKRALYRVKKVAKIEKKAATPTVKTVTVGGPNNGKTRVVAIRKAPRFYNADDVKRPIRNRKHAGKAVLRKSITPGTVLILLAGRFRGKRVVFLKQLESGLLLVTGPYKLNGVPLRRVNQAYVIATSTKLDVAHVKVDETLNDDYFRRPKAAVAKKGEQEFFGDKKAKKQLPEARVKDQKAVDSQLLPLVKKTPQLSAYLKSTFSLSTNSLPHLMKF